MTISFADFHQFLPCTGLPPAPTMKWSNFGRLMAPTCLSTKVTLASYSLSTLWTLVRLCQQAMTAPSRSGITVSASRLFKCQGLFGVLPTTNWVICSLVVKISLSRPSQETKHAEMRDLTSSLTKRTVNKVQNQTNKDLTWLL